MLGHFLEIGVAVSDIAASVRFYERLGFRQLSTTDAWSHPYGVLSDGRLHLGLHQRPMATPTLTFVRPKLASYVQTLRAAGMDPLSARLGDEAFHELQLQDPSGQSITLLEARTYSPAPPGAVRESLCGYFAQYSLPVTEVGLAREFWERAGFVALAETDQPYPHSPVTGDLLDLAFHQRRSIDAPLLVFEAVDMPQRIAQLAQLDMQPLPQLPRGLARLRNALVAAPEGTLLLLLST